MRVSRRQGTRTATNKSFRFEAGKNKGRSVSNFGSECTVSCVNSLKLTFYYSKLMKKNSDMNLVIILFLLLLITELLANLRFFFF